MKKVVLKLDLLDERIKQKAMKSVSRLQGVESMAMNMKDKKLTVTGDVDPVTVLSKLRKICGTDIVSVGPAKEEKKKEEGGGDKKKEDDKKKEKEDDKKRQEEAMKLAYAAYPHNPHPPRPYYYNFVQDTPRIEDFLL